MYDGFVEPSVIVFEVFYSRVKQYDVTGVYDSGLNRITATFTADQIKAMPLIADFKVRFDSVYPLVGTIKPSSTGSQSDVVGYTINISGDSYTVVEILGMGLVNEQVAIASEKAAEAAADRIQTGLDRISVANDKAAVSADKAIVAADKATTVAAKAAAEEARDIANDAKTGAETARDVAISVSVEKIYVATYAEAVPYFTGSKSREVYVEADEAYYEGDPSWYKYDPQLGTALLGIDFNYTQE
jgi:hypothetical protein